MKTVINFNKLFQIFCLGDQIHLVYQLIELFKIIRVMIAGTGFPYGYFLNFHAKIRYLLERYLLDKEIGHVIHKIRKSKFGYIGPIALPVFQQFQSNQLLQGTSDGNPTDTIGLGNFILRGDPVALLPFTADDSLTKIIINRV